MEHSDHNSGPAGGAAGGASLRCAGSGAGVGAVMAGPSGGSLLGLPCCPRTHQSALSSSSAPSPQLPEDGRLPLQRLLACSPVPLPVSTWKLCPGSELISFPSFRVTSLVPTTRCPKSRVYCVGRIFSHRRSFRQRVTQPLPLHLCCAMSCGGL